MNEDGSENTIISYHNSSYTNYGFNVPYIDDVTIQGISFIEFGVENWRSSLIQITEAKTDNSTLSVKNCYFNSGVIQASSIDEWVSILNFRDSVHLEVTITECLFEENDCALIKGTGVITILDSTFIRNSKTLFDLISATLIMYNSVLDSNTESKDIFEFSFNEY